MHESAVAESLIRILAEEAARHGAARITRVRLQVGALAGVEPRTLSACFELFAEGTAAEGARLDFETIPVLGRCRACGAETELRRRGFACPACGADGLELSGGRGLTVAAIDIQPRQGVQP